MNLKSIIVISSLPIIFFGFIFSGSGYSQNDQTTKINQQYKTYRQQLKLAKENETEFTHPSYQITTETMERAIGLTKTSLQLFYDRKEIVPRPPFPKTYTLRRAIIHKSFSSTEELQEYFFDTNGKLLFFYNREIGWRCGEQKLFFHQGNLIQFESKTLKNSKCDQHSENASLDASTQFPQVKKNNHFTKEETIFSKKVIQEAKNLDNILQFLAKTEIHGL